MGNMIFTEPKELLIDKFYKYNKICANELILIPLFKELKDNIKKQLNIKRGAFLFEEKNQIMFFLYIKLDKDKLLEGLPISYKNYPGYNYLSLIIDHNGRDYIGQNTKDKIDYSISVSNMHNILDNNFNEIKKQLPSLDLTEYEYYKNFAYDQFDRCK